MRSLTARQRQVLLLTAAGCTAVQTGRRLDIHVKTVARHLAEIYKALGAHDRAHAVALAIYRGEISIAELASIAGGSTVRAAEAPSEAAGGPQGAPEAVDGARDVRGAAGAAQSPVGEPRGRAA